MYHIISETECPVCHCMETLFLDDETNLITCISCGYRFNEKDDIQRLLDDVLQKETQQNSELDIYYRINEIAEQYFQSKLNTECRAYLYNRGFDQSDIERFGFGYADGKLVQYMKGLGYTTEQLIKAGLCHPGSKKDFFFYRLMIPVRDNNHHIIGFGGRVLDDSKPKYINSPESILFHKSSVFFGIDRCNMNSDAVILCEGYMDVISMHKAGFDTAIAAMGTALTMNHIMILKQLHKNVLCMYDSDDAGISAARKNMLLLQKNHVSCYGIDLSPDKDPDEFLKHRTPEELSFRIEHPLSRTDIILRQKTIINKTEYINSLFHKIKELSL